MGGWVGGREGGREGGLFAKVKQCDGNCNLVHFELCIHSCRGKGGCQ